VLLRLDRTLSAGRSTLTLKPDRRGRRWLKRALRLRVALKAKVTAVGGGTPVEIVRRATVGP
jgi:DNA-binding transcriptional regulator/RsmH inhibitor MraZ